MIVIKAMATKVKVDIEADMTVETKDTTTAVRAMITEIKDIALHHRLSISRAIIAMDKAGAETETGGVATRTGTAVAEVEEDLATRSHMPWRSINACLDKAKMTLYLLHASSVLAIWEQQFAATTTCTIIMLFSESIDLTSTLNFRLVR